MFSHAEVRFPSRDLELPSQFSTLLKVYPARRFWLERLEKTHDFLRIYVHGLLSSLSVTV
jgi:hypothetical protein